MAENNVYVDLNMQGNRVRNASASAAGSDYVIKDELDAAIRGLDWKQSVRAASTGNLNLAAPGATIDGVSMNSGDRFLAKDQSTGSQNGIYQWNGAASAATRTLDADADAEVTSGLAVTSTEGTTNGDRAWVLTTNDPIVVGTTALVFTQLGGSGSSYTAGAGLTESPAFTFNVGQGIGIIVNADDVAVDPAVVLRKYSVDFGNGSSTAFVINHALNNANAMTIIKNNSTSAIETANVVNTDANNVTITFNTAPSSNAFKAIVHG